MAQWIDVASDEDWWSRIGDLNDERRVDLCFGVLRRTPEFIRPQFKVLYSPEYVEFFEEVMSVHPANADHRRYLELEPRSFELEDSESDQTPGAWALSGALGVFMESAAKRRFDQSAVFTILGQCYDAVWEADDQAEADRLTGTGDDVDHCANYVAFQRELLDAATNA